MTLRKKGYQAWDERCDHIDWEHFRSKQKVEDWVSYGKVVSNGELMETRKAEDREAGKGMGDEDESDGDEGNSSSDEDEREEAPGRSASTSPDLENRPDMDAEIFTVIPAPQQFARKDESIQRSEADLQLENARNWYCVCLTYPPPKTSCISCS